MRMSEKSDIIIPYVLMILIMIGWSLITYSMCIIGFEFILSMCVAGVLWIILILVNIIVFELKTKGE